MFVQGIPAGISTVGKHKAVGKGDVFLGSEEPLGWAPTAGSERQGKAQTRASPGFPETRTDEDTRPHAGWVTAGCTDTLQPSPCSLPRAPPVLPVPQTQENPHLHRHRQLRGEKQNLSAEAVCPGKCSQTFSNQKETNGKTNSARGKGLFGGTIKK